MSENELSMEERLLAAVAHASVIITGVGVLVGILIWLTQKEKYPYAVKQAVQAAIYQLIGTILIVGLWMVDGLLGLLSIIPIIQHPEMYENTVPWLVWASLVFMIVPFVVMFVWWIYGCWAAYRSWKGVDFRYLLIGRVLSSEKWG